MPFRLPPVVTFYLSACCVSVSVAAATAEKTYEADGGALTPDASHQTMRTPPDLTLDLLAAEPQIEQPVFMNFDARGRMWVVEYRQYPEPAGLKIVSRDRFWRNIYDRKPMPPGHPDFVPGLDRITIHEDTNGDGTFDHSKTFVDGLNLATSCVSGDGGVWVLNPPYLLFYPDADADDVPDGDPIVHLDGFGIQDSHSVVNSLCWGPDGWLYASQGSTVTSDIVVTGSNAAPVSRIGQLIWRYHPTLRQYEVFAEGGGNVWSCEFDSQGRLFAGTNDKFPAYFFLQGGYYRKNFGKHGALSNPHAYDYFDGIDAPGHRRISNSVLVYEGGALPARYEGALLYLASLQGRVDSYRLTPQDLNFHGQQIDLLVDASDRWFRPVFMETGPDGAVYVCDWYDQQINHYRNHEGTISKLDGRLFRLRAQDASPIAPFDLTQRSTSELVELLNHQNRWWRETARRLLGWRSDRASVVPQLRQILAAEKGQFALEALWALNLCDAVDTETVSAASRHENSAVRQWAIRLLGDRGHLAPLESQALNRLAAAEDNLEVLSQLASSAKRLGGLDAYNLLTGMLGNQQCAGSDQLDRMMWWALESLYAPSPTLFVDLAAHLENSNQRPPAPILAEFMMRRMAAGGSREDLLRCTEVLRNARSTPVRLAMIRGVEAAYQGRPMAGLPRDLTAQLVSGNHSPLSLRLRLAPDETQAEAIKTLSSAGSDAATVLRVLEVLGEIRIEAALPALFVRLESPDEATQWAALRALQLFDEAEVAQRLIAKLPELSAASSEAAQSFLSGRRAWAKLWVASLEAGGPSVASISNHARDNLRRFDDPEFQATIDRLFGAITPSTHADFEAEISRINHALSVTGGDPQRGRKHFQQRCAACHTLFEAGGQLGPDLTSYQRDQTAALLLSIVQPNAEIRSGYEMVTVKSTDGRILSGFLTRDDLDIVGVRIVGGGEIILHRDQVESVEIQSRSLMPEGLLQGLNENELRDFFSYLRSPQPLALP
jgi:putative membrane-bound dehydrogenase-like protein